MLYLLDANVLITANNLYYEFARVPEFWDWLLHMGEAGHIKLPIEVLEEIISGTDDLSEWLSQKENRRSLELAEDVNITFVQQVINKGYAPDLSDDEIEMIGRDPFLIAYALVDPAERCVVTTEVSKPSKQRANRHIPDVCKTLGVTSVDSFHLIRALNFSTSWRP
ncbi:DUF4411 family protein [Methylocystis sp. NLS-7]|nr:DUF4411 family protein [Methylocystis suflitae]